MLTQLEFGWCHTAVNSADRLYVYVHPCICCSLYLLMDSYACESEQLCSDFIAHQFKFQPDDAMSQFLPRTSRLTII